MKLIVTHLSTLLVASSLVIGVAGCSSDDDDKSTPAPDAGGQTDTLYQRLGGHQGIRSALDAIIVEELKDPEIAPFFALVGTPGHPTGSQIGECFTNLLGRAAGGPETYPTVAEGFQCRDMKTSHAGLMIPDAIFDKFVTIAAGVLKTAGVADADITTIGGVLNGTKADIVDPSAG